MSEPTKDSWIYRTTVAPVLDLLRRGTSPERLAWSLAVGFVIGINPVLGSTTVACLAVAFLLRLNLVASQITTHLVYPLQLLLLLPLLRLGTRVFRAPQIPLSPAQLLHVARTHPMELTRRLWVWESHALLGWLLFAVFAAPLLATLLTPLMRRLHARMKLQPCVVLAGRTRSTEANPRS